jgi:uncharacterized protein YndB with AHSA1/START domain
MTKTDTLKVTTPSDREIAMIRSFDAPRRLVFEAFIKPELLQRWLLGPDGWTMPVCEVDARPGGKYRYVWRKAGKGDMGTGGVFSEVTPPERIVCTEKFDDPWYEGESIVTTIFEEQNGRTTVTQTMLFDNQATRDGVLKSGMESGVAVSYDRLAEILAAQCE